jgi:hypothetical protein
VNVQFPRAYKTKEKLSPTPLRKEPKQLQAKPLKVPLEPKTRRKSQREYLPKFQKQKRKLVLFDLVYE